MERYSIETRKETRMRLESSAPFLPCVSCDLCTLLDQVRRNRVPGPTQQILVFFVVQEPLACIRFDKTTAEILMHPLLNTTETPLEIFQHILTHEMLHLVIPARDVDGENTTHPPEFFEQEAALAPERQESFSWIWFNFAGCLKADKKREKIIVKRGWKRLMHSPRASMERCQEIQKQLTL